MKKIIATIIALVPTIAFAQNTITNVNGVFNRFTQLGTSFIQLLIGLAVVYIVYYIVRYFIAGGSGDEGARGKAGMNIFWGIVGLFIILSIWGLVNILKQSFNTETVVPVETGLIPSIPGINPSVNNN